IYSFLSYFCLFTDTATTEIYSLSLHDALPISYEPLTVTAHLATAYSSVDSWSPSLDGILAYWWLREQLGDEEFALGMSGHRPLRSEEHTSELQSRENLVCRLLLEKKKNYHISE